MWERRRTHILCPWISSYRFLIYSTSRYYGTTRVRSHSSVPVLYFTFSPTHLAFFAWIVWLICWNKIHPIIVSQRLILWRPDCQGLRIFAKKSCKIHKDIENNHHHDAPWTVEVWAFFPIILLNWDILSARVYCSSGRTQENLQKVSAFSCIHLSSMKIGTKEFRIFQ